MDLKDQFSSLSASPQKVLKIVLSISVVLLVMWLFMISRMEYGGTKEPADPTRQERVDSLRITLNQSGKGGIPPREGSTDFFANAFVTFLVLITILGIVWLWSRKKTDPPAETSLNEIGGHLLGQGAQLKILEINDEIWVLGISGGGVNLLHRYSKEEWRGPTSRPEVPEKNFYQMFKDKL